MKKNKFKIIALIVLSAVVFSINAFANPSYREIILNVITPPLAWNESKVDQKLRQTLSRTADIRIKLVSELSDEHPVFPENYYNLDTLLNWGMEVGGRFIMLVDIKSERLEKKKTFHIPLIFHKYQTFGIIEGELRIIDIKRGKLLTAETFKIEQKGPRILQASMDDEKSDPDLHISAPDKLQFFDKLEDKLTKYLKKRTRAVIGSRL